MGDEEGVCEGVCEGVIDELGEPLGVKEVEGVTEEVGLWVGL